MARRDTLFHARWTGGERERRLRDEILWRGFELGAKLFERDLAGSRADQHAEAARAVHLLHNQLVQIIEHICEMFFLAAPPGRHGLQQRLDRKSTRLNS